MLGIGGTPEGVISAAALKCVGGGIQGRLWPRNDQERQALLLRFVENKTQSEIAAVLGVSQVHVSRLLAKTLAELRDQLPGLRRPD